MSQVQYVTKVWWKKIEILTSITTYHALFILIFFSISECNTKVWFIKTFISINVIFYLIFIEINL